MKKAPDPEWKLVAGVLFPKEQAPAGDILTPLCSIGADFRTT